MRVLNVSVDAALLRSWVSWLAPPVQPFYLGEQEIADWNLTAGDADPDMQARDTYEVYGVTPGLRPVWLDEPTFAALDRPVRTALVRAQVRYGRAAVPTVPAWVDLLGSTVVDQAGGRRFVWWPSMLTDRPERTLARVLGDVALPSDHAAVRAATWSAAADVLPGARALAGTFADGSGANCFGTVMAAAGVPGAESVWMQRQPFEDWLAAAATPVRRGTNPGPDPLGTVLVWRSPDRAVQHAAVCLGDGWVLQKPSQSWQTPRQVLTVADTLRWSRTPGRRLQRYALTAIR